MGTYAMCSNANTHRDSELLKGSNHVLGCVFAIGVDRVDGGRSAPRRGWRMQPLRDQSDIAAVPIARSRLQRQQRMFEQSRLSMDQRKGAKSVCRSRCQLPIERRLWGQSGLPLGILSRDRGGDGDAGCVFGGGDRRRYHARSSRHGRKSRRSGRSRGCSTRCPRRQWPPRHSRWQRKRRRKRRRLRHRGG